MDDPTRDPNQARASAHAAGSFAPAARRTLLVFGAEAELVWLPYRNARPNRPGATRPPFDDDRGLAILESEATWRDRGLALTGNKYPFAKSQTVLWSERPLREPDESFLAAAFAWSDALGGSLLVNSVGAAASIARAHAHHAEEALPFLAQLEQRGFEAEWLPRVTGVSWLVKDAPFFLLGVRGEAKARAAAIAALQTRRLTAAVNLVSSAGESWVFPRSVETPAPFFPYPLGAAEIWGRWCYLEESAFAQATAADLERALVTAGCRGIEA